MKRIIYAALACLTFASCEDFLDKQPIEQIGTDEYFKDEASLEKYTNGFLNSYTPSSGDVTRGDGNCDIIEVKQTSSYLYQPVWNSSLQGGWSNSTWNFVYYINTFLERMHEAQGVSEAAFAHYEGTARFWRAWNYFELVKTFGGVPWYDHVVRSDSEEDLYKPRDSREYVMERVLEDLNYACEHCYTSEAWVDNQKINRYIALAIKSRICLFEGTYRKYHRVDPSTGKAWDPEYNKDNKWLREAADACEELMEAGVDCLKIEGRAKSAYYAAIVTGAYRHCLDDAAAGRPADPVWRDEVDHISDRRFSSGFFFGQPGQYYQNSRYIRDWQVCAVVTDCDADGHATLSLRNKFAMGDEVELVGPDTRPFTMTVPLMEDADGLPLTEPRTPQMVFRMQFPRPVPPMSFVRHAVELSAKE